jgi:receptor protein-tyrosine kinase
MPPNPSEMLGSAQMRSLLETLRDTQDYVVIDTPPLLPVTDAAVLSVLADGCVVTTRFGKTRREQLGEAVNTLAGIDAKLLGVVLNRVPQAAAVARGYGYGYKADLGREPIPPVGDGAGRRATRRRRRHGAATEDEAA